MADGQGESVTLQLPALLGTMLHLQSDNSGSSVTDSLVTVICEADIGAFSRREHEEADKHGGWVPQTLLLPT